MLRLADEGRNDLELAGSARALEVRAMRASKLRRRERACRLHGRMMLLQDPSPLLYTLNLRRRSINSHGRGVDSASRQENLTKLSARAECADSGGRR